MKQFSPRYPASDVCMPLNVAHNYSHTHDVLVELEMDLKIMMKIIKNMNLTQKLLLKECSNYIDNIIKMKELV